MTTKNQWTDEKIEAALKAYGSTIKDLNPLVDEATKAAEQRRQARFQRILCVAGLVMFALFVVVMLSGCSGDGSTGGSLEGLRPAGQPTSAPATSPTLPAQIVEKTVVVEATVIIDRPVEVTRVVEVVATPTPEPAPEINGFDMSRPAVDESVQPCPAKFWKRGRCVATQAQIDQAAGESK